MEKRSTSIQRGATSVRALGRRVSEITIIKFLILSKAKDSNESISN